MNQSTTLSEAGTDKMMSTTEKPTLVQLPLKESQRAIVDQLRTIVRERFVPRADHYDRSATFPAEDFEDLFRAQLNAPVVPREYGGLGLGPYRGDVFTLWMMTKEIAKSDLSLARRWEVHVNSLVLLDGMAHEEQKPRWCRGVVDRGDKWVAWSGEAQAQKPGEPMRFGTNVRKVDGGYIVEGNKVFSTSAGGAQWAILLVNTAGPGGVRHATAESLESQLLMG